MNYATANGTATAGSDYTATSGTLTFNPGVTSQTISVPIINDTAVEGNETFTVTLSDPAMQPWGSHRRTPTRSLMMIILVQSSSVQPLTVSTRMGAVSYHGHPDRGSSGAVGVSYATSNGTATAGSDYTSTSGTLTFTSGTTPDTQQILVPIVGDLVGELTEDFTVTLLNAGGATISGGSGDRHDLRQRSAAADVDH